MNETAATGPGPATTPTTAGIASGAVSGRVAGGAVRAAIARAAQATGVDFDYLLAQAKLESGLDPNARAAASSATGLYQFVGGTWLDTLKKHGAEHGLDWASAAAADPARRAEVMALRRDPAIAALMAAELAGDNHAALGGVLGRTPDAAELYLAHFLGAQGAAQFLTALAADPARSAAAVVPGAAAANRAVFFDSSGAPRSLGAVMELLRGRLGAAMEGGAADQWAAAVPASGGAGAALPPPRGGPVARAFHAAALNAGPPARSMAETLRETFSAAGAGSAGEGTLPAHVRQTYRRLAALGL